MHKPPLPPDPCKFMVHFSPHLLTHSLFGQEMTIQMTEHKLGFKVQTKKHGNSIRFPRHKKKKAWHFYGLLIFIFSLFQASKGIESAAFEQNNLRHTMNKSVEKIHSIINSETIVWTAGDTCSFVYDIHHRKGLWATMIHRYLLLAL